MDRTGSVVTVAGARGRRAPWLGLVVALAAAAGAVDAISYLMAQVFTANMTGNVVLLGLAAARHDTAAALRSGIAFLGFAAGAAAGGWVASWSTRGHEGRDGGGAGWPWPGAVVAALLLEVPLMVAAEALLLAAGGERLGTAPRDALVVLTGAAMGAQSAAMRRVALPNVATTYVTGTLTALLATTRGGSRRPSHRPLQAAVIAVYSAAAFAAGALERGVGPAAGFAVAVVAFLAVAATAVAGWWRAPHRVSEPPVPGRAR